MGVDLIRARPNLVMTRFSSTSGTMSAIDPSDARTRRSTSVVRSAGETFSEPQWRVARRHASLYATPAPQSSPNGYSESGLRGWTTANASGMSLRSAGGLW
mgnify:CR=1 FL=1